MTDKPHTPTTTQIREDYAHLRYHFADGWSIGEERVQFDDWLTAEIAAAEQRGAVKAWRNGYVHGVHDERLREQIGAAEEPNRANPHVTNNRAGQMEGDE